MRPLARRRKPLNGDSDIALPGGLAARVRRRSPRIAMQVLSADRSTTFSGLSFTIRPRKASMWSMVMSRLVGMSKGFAVPS